MINTSFIDHNHAEQITKWTDKYPEKAKAYFKEHNELSDLFINHKIVYAEFHKRSEKLKQKYNFLGK